MPNILFSIQREKRSIRRLLPPASIALLDIYGWARQNCVGDQGDQMSLRKNRPKWSPTQFRSKLIPNF
jgi:hypothetical protein